MQCLICLSGPVVTEDTGSAYRRACAACGEAVEASTPALAGWGWEELEKLRLKQEAEVLEWGLVEYDPITDEWY